MAQDERALVIIPTYNERENIRSIVELVLSQVPNLEILVVDDNSPDGTAAIVTEMAQAEPRVHLLSRAGKLGLGTAYIAGFKWGLSRGYAYLIEMDADFSHDPREIPNMLKAIQEADLVLGSRYIDGVRVVNWPLSRLVLSKGASYYVRIITGLPVYDPTGGFKCFRRKVLETLELDEVRSNGYAFQIEMTHKAWMKGFRIREIPITFADRSAGQSKMSGHIVREALWMVWSLAFAHGFRRKPRATLKTDA
ncbi:MAG TPA: polyprenol monophosphomannose synthase [Verrucomicrobiae bacterium]|nr:polyprenol monophosphomannose synthase [Verrucomicrobiae bacterium]